MTSGFDTFGTALLLLIGLGAAWMLFKGIHYYSDRKRNEHVLTDVRDTIERQAPSDPHLNTAKIVMAAAAIEAARQADLAHQQQRKEEEPHKGDSGWPGDGGAYVSDHTISSASDAGGGGDGGGD